MLGVYYSKLVFGQAVSKKGTNSPPFSSGHSPLPLSSIMLWEETEGQSEEPILIKVTPPWVSWLCSGNDISFLRVQCCVTSVKLFNLPEPDFLSANVSVQVRVALRISKNA